jgi:hypothetical protein
MIRIFALLMFAVGMQAGTDLSKFSNGTAGRYQVLAQSGPRQAQHPYLSSQRNRSQLRWRLPATFILQS